MAPLLAQGTPPSFVATLHESPFISGRPVTDMGELHLLCASTQNARDRCTGRIGPWGSPQQF